MMEDILKTILERAEEKRVYLAIDGRASAGKTTLANFLKKELNATVLSMDDYFLQEHQRTKERYEEAGGNIDYERFIKEVVDLVKEDFIVHQRFNCQTMTLEEVELIQKKGIVIIEGSYSFHPKWQGLFDYSIFVDVSDDLQKERLLKRNPERYEQFLKKWLPLEEKYIESFKIDEATNWKLMNINFL